MIVADFRFKSIQLFLKTIEYIETVTFRHKMQQKDLSFWQLWNLSFGFFGVQIAYALQSANISRIFATLGADPHQLSFFLGVASAYGHDCPALDRQVVG
jgi:hypothetical protein